MTSLATTLIAAALLCPPLAAAETGLEVVRLENARVVVEVVPRLAGRIAAIRRPDGENVLNFVPAVLNRPVPEPTLDGGYFHCNGHVIWVGPQAGWWTQQEGNPARRADHATWPPDPWLEYGAMEVASRSADAVSLIGPVSQVTGLRLKTTVRITPDGEASQTIEAVNASQRSVAWDLWPNTRVRGDAQVYAPYPTGSRLKVEWGSSDPVAEMPLQAQVADGFLTFDTRLAPGTEGKLHLGKAFLAATDARLYAAAGRDLLIAVARTTPKGEVHPDHAPVEVFQCVGGDPLRHVLELEFHAGYRTLAPGESMRYAVAWKVVPLEGEATTEARLRAIRAHEADAQALHRLVD